MSERDFKVTRENTVMGVVPCIDSKGNRVVCLDPNGACFLLPGEADLLADFIHTKAQEARELDPNQSKVSYGKIS